MLISQADMVVFVHNPRTGGMSMISALGYPTTKSPNRLTHAFSDEMIALCFQKTWSNFTSFAFVRDPWERIYSIYKYQKSLPYANLFGNSISNRMANDYDFSEWITVNRRVRRATSNWFGVPQVRWTRAVKHVFKFEELGEAVDQLESLLGRSLDVDRKNSTDLRSVRELELPNEQIDFVADLDRETIERFGYVY